MSVRVKWAAGLVLAGAALWIFYAVFISGPKVEKFKAMEAGVGNAAPDFVLQDVRGKDVRLSRYRDRVVLLVFMTTWCSYCRAEIPYLKDLHARYGSKGLVILNIDIQESREKAAAYASKHELPFNTLLDIQGDVMQQYAVRGVPSKTLIDRNGQILCLNCRVLESHLAGQFDGPSQKGG
jgi:peroxiredoxin